MRMEWRIHKERGYLRPVLYYTVTMEEHEKKLALPPISVLSCIPVPEEHWQEYCYPGQFERGAVEEGGETAERKYYSLEIPSHQGHSWQQALRLPWRESNEYPEVEASFIQLRAVFEKELAGAYASLPMKTEGSLQTSAAARRNVAPAVLGERLLLFADKTRLRNIG
jgi:hypothetical protein